MKYFEYIPFVLLAVFIIIPAIWIRFYMRLRYIQKLTRINILRRQQQNEKIVLYSADILNACCTKLYLSRHKDAAKALRLLVIGKIEAAAEILSVANPQLAMLLHAHQNAEIIYSKINRNRKRWLKSEKYAVYLPILAHLCGDTSNFLTAIRKIQQNPDLLRKKNIAAYNNYILSYAYLNEGDMLSASQTVSKAQNYFKRKRYIMEEAACCITLAEIYRISCVEDIAQTMLDSAIKTYREHHLALHTAQATAMLGMLMLFEGRYEEAEDKYAESLKIATTTRMKADVFNQLILLYLVRNQLNKAEKYAKQAEILHKKLNNQHGLAFCLQLRAHIRFNQQHYLSAEKLLNQSLVYYQKLSNFSATAECLYLLAEATYKMKKYAKSEKFLRELLDLCRHRKNNFHVANAYSLLGLIYLKTNENQRAKVLFQQSLQLEQNHSRCEGLVVDYANLALIEQISGNTDNATQNLQTALEYAQKSGDKNLQSLIEKKLKSLS